MFRFVFVFALRNLRNKLWGIFCCCDGSSVYVREFLFNFCFYWVFRVFCPGIARFLRNYGAFICANVAKGRQFAAVVLFDAFDLGVDVDGQKETPLPKRQRGQ